MPPTALSLPFRALPLVALLAVAACTSDFGVQPYDPDEGYGTLEAGLTGEFPGSKWTPSPNYTNASRKVGSVKVVVVHTTQGACPGCIGWMANPKAKVSAHYVVQKNGVVTQMVKEEDIAWHAGSANGYTIGIEHEGFISDPNWATPAMLESSAKLTCYLVKKWKLPASKTGIKGHVELPNQTHTDPGKFWPWASYLAKVQGCVNGAPPPKCPPSCDDKNVCTTDSCSNFKCVHANNGAACNDNNACTSGEKCSGGGCKGGTAKNCDDKNACTNDSCTGGTCKHANNTVACNDGNGCTVGEACSGGGCKGGTAKSCDDKNACTDDSCSGGACKNAPNTAVCWDGDACTVGEKCAGGKCGGGTVAKDCNDGNPCTQDACSKGACVHTAGGGACDDGDGCTTGDACAAGKCAGGKAKVCSDGNPCTADACKGGGCVFAPNTVPCDDGDPCTSGDGCGGGTCAGGVPKACDDNNACTDDTCSKGACKHAPNAAACDDGDGCTGGDACAGGSCKGGAAKGCDDANPCTKDACTAGACVAAPIDGACDDGDDCTEKDACAAGSCKGAAKDCDDELDCTVDSCKDGKCAHEGDLKPVATACSGDDVVETDVCGGVGKVLDTCSDGMKCDGGQCVPIDAPDAGGDAQAAGDDAAAQPPEDAAEGQDAAGAGNPKPDADASAAKPDAKADATAKSDTFKAGDGTGPGATDGGGPGAAVDNAVPEASGCSAARTGGPAWAWLLVAACVGLLRRRRIA